MNSFEQENKYGPLEIKQEVKQERVIGPDDFEIERGRVNRPDDFIVKPPESDWFVGDRRPLPDIPLSVPLTIAPNLISGRGGNPSPLLPNRNKKTTKPPPYKPIVKGPFIKYSLQVLPK